MIIGFVLSRKLRRKCDKEPLTLGMLEKAIEVGKTVSPIVTPKGIGP